MLYKSIYYQYRKKNGYTVIWEEHVFWGMRSLNFRGKEHI